MAKNPLAAQMKKEENLFANEISQSATKALQAKSVQAKADEQTNSSTSKPPKVVTAVFDKVLKDEQKRIQRSYSGLIVTLTVSYNMNGPRWIATATAVVKYPLEQRGGMSYVVQCGDTLWSIAEATYGSGYYWTEIQKANPAATACSGNFILAGVGLKLPAIDVVPAISTQPVTIKKASGPDKTAGKKARPVATPVVEIDLEKSKSVTTVYKLPGLTITVTTSLKGSLKAQKPGTLPGSFNLRTYETEIANGAKPFQSSIKVKKLQFDSISIGSNVSGSIWSSKVSFNKTGAVTLSIAPKPVKFKNGGIIYEGNVGLDISIRAVPDMKLKPAPKSVLDSVGEWFTENGRALAGAGLLVGAGAIIVVTIGEDIVTLGAGIADDPVSFAAAAAMANRGLVMIK